MLSRSSFLYHFLPAVPFGCLAVAMVVAQAWGYGGWRRMLAAGYVVVVVASFIYFYPICSGLPISHTAFDSRMWLRCRVASLLGGTALEWGTISRLLSRLYRSYWRQPYLLGTVTPSTTRSSWSTASRRSHCCSS